MFNNVGKKLKIFASIGFILCVSLETIIGSAVVAGYYIAPGPKSITPIVVFVLFLLISILLLYIIGMFVYGFGELIDRAQRNDVLLENLVKIESQKYAEHRSREDYRSKYYSPRE